MIKQLLKVIFGLSVALTMANCATTGSSSKKMSKEAKVFVKDLATKRPATYVNAYTCPRKASKVDSKDWKLLVKKANACLAKKNYKMTEKLAEVLAYEHHLAPWGAYFKSIVAEKRGDLQRALWMIDLAMKKAPGKGILLYQKGRLLWGQGEATQAMALYEMAVKDDDTLSDAHMALGQVYYRDQDYETAAKHFLKVTQLEPKTYNAHIGLAECYLEDKKPAQAVESLEEAIRLQPKALDLRMRQAVIIESELEDFELALKKYQRIYDLGRRKRLDRPVTENLQETIKRLQTKVSKNQPGQQISQRKPAKQEVKQ